MQFTKNYNLKKPDPLDHYNVADYNENADLIDEQLKRLDAKEVEFPEITPENIGAVPADRMSRYNFTTLALNSVNIDEVYGFNYIMAISSDGSYAGTVPASGWLNVLNLYSLHFVTQIVCSCTLGHEKARPVVMWVRERYTNETSDWSAWRKMHTDSTFNGAGYHNSVYRDANLGSNVTAEQYAAIKSGSFDDMYIGDYWIINGIVYRIAAFDYYLNTGDTSATEHHIVLVPDNCMYLHAMNSSGSTMGGYAGSRMRSVGLTQAITTIQAAFGDHLYSHRLYLVNHQSSGINKGGGWYGCTVELMNEQMLYGNSLFGAPNDGTTLPYNYRVEKSQLPLFMYDPSKIIDAGKTGYWLRDIASENHFVSVNGEGISNYHLADLAVLGVRPFFCIKG